MPFQLALYEYTDSEDQHDNLHLPIRKKRTKAWDNFVNQLVSTAGRQWFAARDNCLREEYNAHISYDPYIDQLVFETEQDMVLFLLRWS